MRRKINYQEMKKGISSLWKQEFFQCTLSNLVKIYEFYLNLKKVNLLTKLNAFLSPLNKNLTHKNCHLLVFVQHQHDEEK